MMEILAAFLVTLLFAVALAWFVRRVGIGASPQSAPPPAPLATERDDLYDLIVQLNNVFTNVVAVPADLEEDPRFRRLVEIFESRKTDALLQYVHGSLTVPACAALRVLASRRDDADIAAPVIACLNHVNPYTRTFALRAVHARAKEPVLKPVIHLLNPSWLEPLSLDALREFVAARLAAGESPDVFKGLPFDAESRQNVDLILEQLGPTCAPLATAWKPGASGAEVEEVAPSGAEAPESAARPAKRRRQAAPIEHVALRRVVDRLMTNLTSSMPRSTLLVGDPLVGKSAAVRALTARLRREGWKVVERSAADLVADQSFVGQVEGRVKDLVRTLRHGRTIWIVPDFIDLVWAGRHQQNPVGVLEMLLPHIESGAIRVLGEIRTMAFERLLQNVPRVRGALESIRLLPLGDEETLDIARRWAQAAGEDGAQRPTEGNAAEGDTPSVATDEVLRETLQLAKHFSREGALPGSMLQLLQWTRQRLAAEDRGANPIQVSDVLATLSDQTGIPKAILDEHHELDLGALKAFFSERILGQDEAVDCLVERVSMLKAGLVDPSRPAGVFLFVGPTGTGKTAVAKALAEYLFGSPDRMIRLDMSEFQTELSLERLIGSGGPRALEVSLSLAQSIRSQPFSVVLLDEFEKAHHRIWDLFLQVFDDGRLTDRWGQTADFRHAIIILTSNLGVAAGKGPGIGFSGADLTYSVAAVGRAVDETFRPEFLNRIDRIVIFRPLHRAVMRQVLEKELRAALRLRGLRTRDWAVEWDDSAVDFLLARGFSTRLGARPLKRAIERFFLAPLAETIVSRRYPQGDQFVFIHADGDRLTAKFVDPEAPASEAAPTGLLREAIDGSGVGAPSLRALIRGADGMPNGLAFLEFEYRRLLDLIEAEAWQARKRAALESMSAPGFWNSEDRFTVLGRAEYMDRIEAGLKRAGALLARLARPDAARASRPPRDLLQRLAHQLYLLDAAHAGFEAGKGRDAFVLVEASRDSQTPPEDHDAFAGEIGSMYRQWAQSRGMRLTAIEERNGDTHRPYRLLLDVSGYAAYSILEPESGMHVLESSDPRGGRARAYVFIVAQPDAPERRARQEVEAALRELSTDESVRRRIVRRYRREPSPLVRDAVREWRTGRLDLVLGGQFDLME